MVLKVLEKKIYTFSQRPSPYPDVSRPSGADRGWHFPCPSSPGIQTAVDLVHGEPGV